ncbi:MAG: ACT domain-containing protein [Bacteroidales bacterium]|nr:ACT domain-containing protein [Bacteroidales bacterium]
MTLQIIDREFTICKVTDYTGVDLNGAFVFTGATDEEKSLVCPTESVPKNAVARDDGWKAFRIEGTLDFSLTGILARISSILAENGIGIFAISTYNTDYILVKSDNLDRAIKALEKNGYRS